MIIKKFIAQKVYDPLYSLHQGDESIRDLYKKYRKMQWNSIEKNNKILAKKLFNLINYASRHIPYYRTIVEKKGIHFTEKTIFTDLRKFPILTKDIIRKEFKSLYVITPDIKWYYNSSGGSTGEPVRLIQNTFYSRNSDAIKRLQKEWTGYEFGDKMIKLWGSEKDIFCEKENLRERFKVWVKSVYLLNTFSMDEKKMRDYVNIINKKKPKLIVAYIQSIYELAKFIEKNNLDIYSPKAIITSAGILYPSFRKSIEKVFRCRVFNRYGSREVGDMACECEKHKGLHISIFTHYIEILNGKLQPCKEGEQGDIYVTLLTNFTMPLIRYKIGDMAKYTKETCSCGRGLPLIKEVIGRDMDVFKTRDGKIIQGEFFIHFIGVVYNTGIIERFQVIQKNYELIEIKVVVKDENAFNKNKCKMVRVIKRVMGNKCKIKWVVVPKLQLMKSGKYRYTIRDF